MLGQASYVIPSLPTSPYAAAARGGNGPSPPQIGGACLCALIPVVTTKRSPTHWRRSVSAFSDDALDVRSKSDKHKRQNFHAKDPLPAEATRTSVWRHLTDCVLLPAAELRGKQRVLYQTLRSRRRG